MKSLIFLIVALLTTAQAYSEPKNIVLTEDNSVYFGKSFSYRNVAPFQQEILEKLAALGPSNPLYVVLDTPGGSVNAGLEVIDNFRGQNIHTITLFAASMGFQLVHNLGTRYIIDSGVLMTHKARGGFRGEFPGQLYNRYKFWVDRILALDERVVARTKDKHTLLSYHELQENEFWCQGKACIEEGFADEIVSATCGKGLEGTRLEVKKREFLDATVIFNITYSNCPLVTGVIDVEVVIQERDIVYLEGFEDRLNKFIQETTKELRTTAKQKFFNESLTK